MKIIAFFRKHQLLEKTCLKIKQTSLPQRVSLLKKKIQSRLKIKIPQKLLWPEKLLLEHFKH